MLPVVEFELNRRLAIWNEIKSRGGPDGIEPRLLAQLGIQRGQQGVFRDLEVTSAVSGTRAGITVGVRHTGTSYADDLTEDGIIYHYPVTARRGRDILEVLAMKACGELGLPLFVVITPGDNPGRRNIRLGWAQDHDDEHGLILIVFSDTTGPPVELKPSENDPEHFVLKTSRTRRRAQVVSRPNQSRFRFDLLKRYGVRCAVCDIKHQELLHAAHLCPVEENGSDDPQNGVVLCLNHHRAFDAGLFCVDPETLAVRVKRRYRGTDLGLTRNSIGHLPKLPHRDALQWAWSARSKKLNE